MFSLFNAYIGLTNTLRMFGSAIDPDFSSVMKTGIMLTMSDIGGNKNASVTLNRI
jgi:hypothetical protein